MGGTKQTVHGRCSLVRLTKRQKTLRNVIILILTRVPDEDGAGSVEVVLKIIINHNMNKYNKIRYSKNTGKLSWVHFLFSLRHAGACGAFVEPSYVGNPLDKCRSGKVWSLCVSTDVWSGWSFGWKHCHKFHICEAFHLEK